VQQPGPCEVAVHLDRLLARGHHLDLVASFVEGDLGKEVLLLLKRVSEKGGSLWPLIGHRKSPLAFVRQPCWRPFIRRNADRTNNAGAFAKNEERRLLFFQKRPRDFQVRVLLHVSRSGLTD